MATRKGNKTTEKQPILGRVAPENFVGRDAELRRILELASPQNGPRSLLLYAAPSAGSTELLRQAFDQLFRERAGASPVYFAFTLKDRTAVRAARRFLHTFLVHTLAHRRDEPEMLLAPPAIGEMIDMFSPSDYQWVERLVAAFEKTHAETDERALVRLCFGAPQLAASRGARTLVFIEDAHLAPSLGGDAELGAELGRLAAQSNAPFVISGLRRGLTDALNSSDDAPRAAFASSLHLKPLSDEDARRVAEITAHSFSVSMSEETRDLMVQQFEGSPFYIHALLRAAQTAGNGLENFREFQRLYVDELLGGSIKRRLSASLEEVAPQMETRRTLVRLLHETAENVEGKSSVDVWRRRLGAEGDDLKRILTGLHVRELAGFDASFVETSRNLVWRDYLRASFRLHVAVEPRALVVANTLVDTLKRAPQTMARFYRRGAAAGLREILDRFNHQRVPASLLHNDRFNRIYRGATSEEISSGLEAETDLVRLPQIVHAASCASFHPPMQLLIDEERCAVAHGFDASPYAETNETVWVAAEIDSKLEAGSALAEVWLDRLAQVAHACGFRRYHLWLVTPQGFTDDANQLLEDRGAYGSSRAQLELLTERLGGNVSGAENSPNVFEMVIPMGEDTELIAAHTVEQIARRLDFQPEAISQIKTALVEACINASEHSLSPERKIYQRFSLESDKLVVTVSSRGVAIPPTANNSGGIAYENSNGRDSTEGSRGRRGWGLNLIRTLMDEVEFERVDDGTRLRMTKYLRPKL